MQNNPLRRFAATAFVLAAGSGASWAQEASDGGYVWGPHMTGWDGGWHAMFFGPLFMILFLILLIVVLFPLLRWLGGAWQGTPPPHYPAGRAPLDILRERFARGEIDKDEFEERRRVLGE